MLLESSTYSTIRKFLTTNESERDVSDVAMAWIMLLLHLRVGVFSYVTSTTQALREFEGLQTLVQSFKGGKTLDMRGQVGLDLSYLRTCP